MTIRRTSALAATAGLAILAASLLPGWVETERTIVGYGSARIFWSQEAWSGFFVPWLPIAVVALGAAVTLSLLRADGSAPWLRAARLVASLAAGAAFGAVLLIGHDVVSPNPANVVDGSPGWLVIVGLAAAATLAIAAVVRLASRRRHLAASVGTMVLVVLLGACATDATPSPTGVASVPDWRTDANEPYPFVTPVPDLAPTEIDGEYTRPPTDTYAGDRAACRRCPPFPLDRGESILRFDRGRYEIVHQEPAYRSFGHFTLEGDRLVLFNDPECGTERGTYRIERDGAQLRLTVEDDPCAFDQRTRDLTDRTWTPVDIARGESCQPPNTEAAVTGHWPVPSGC